METIDNIAHWRMKLFSSLLTIVVVLGAITAVPSIALSAREGLWHVVATDVIGLVWLLAIWRLKHIAYTARVLNFLLVIFVIVSWRLDIAAGGRSAGHRSSDARQTVRFGNERTGCSLNSDIESKPAVPPGFTCRDRGAGIGIQNLDGSPIGGSPFHLEFAGLSIPSRSADIDPTCRRHDLCLDHDRRRRTVYLPVIDDQLSDIFAGRINEEGGFGRYRIG